jgi:hypothetical protein
VNIEDQRDLLALLVIDGQSEETFDFLAVFGFPADDFGVPEGLFREVDVGCADADGMVCRQIQM